MMEVVRTKRASVVKDDRRANSFDSVEEVQKIGSGKQTREGSPLKSSSPNRKDSSTSNQVSTVIASERSSMDTSSKSSPANPKGSFSNIKQDDQLESTKTEMGEVREENERLKTLLAKIVKDYQALQMHFFDIVHHDQAKKPSMEAPPPPPPPRDIEEPEFISLSLGTSSSLHKKDEKTMNIINNVTKSKDADQIEEEGLALGLDCKFERSSSNNMSPSNSVEEATTKEEEIGEPWPPSKILKNLRSGSEVDEVSQQTHVKKTRVSVRARCDAPTMHDGCQWRKYGQKIAKGNPCPRAYYRCTVAPACPVRKQVQRCAEDMSILITTYEGTHNHPLPISATAMASTTSAAACMLMSGSSTSRSPVIGSSPPSSASIAPLNPNLNALNFNLSNPNPSSRPFYLPNPSISSTPSYPTITLDLTSPAHTTSQTSQFSSRYPSSNFTTTNSSAPRYYSTNFNFSSNDSNPSLPTNWSNGSYLSYNKSPLNPMGSFGLGQSYLQKSTNQIGTAATQQVITETIAKAITSDPSFQSALAAAITSYVGGPNVAQSDGLNGCGPNFLTRATGGPGVSGTQQGSLMFLQPSPPSALISSSKSASASPVDNRENINN